MFHVKHTIPGWGTQPLDIGYAEALLHHLLRRKPLTNLVPHARALFHVKHPPETAQHLDGLPGARPRSHSANPSMFHVKHSPDSTQYLDELLGGLPSGDSINVHCST